MKNDGTHQKRICPNCGREIQVCNFERHYKACVNGYKNQLKKTQIIVWSEDLKCPFCSKQAKNKNSYSQHFVRCSKNPNRTEASKRDFKLQYANLSDDVRDAMKWNKGLTKDTDERVSINGLHASEARPKSLSDYVYYEYNLEQINLWRQYISTITIDVNYQVNNNGEYNFIEGLNYKNNSTINVVWEHRYIANICLSGNLTDSNVIHHIDYNKQNNDKNNLIVFETTNDHSKFHGSKYAKLKYNEDTHLFSCYLEKGLA